MNSWPDFHDIDPYEAGEYDRDYHSVVTIQLVELLDMNWVKWYLKDDDGNKSINEDWAWDYYSEEQYYRLCDKFNDRFMWDEISLLPPLRWKQQLIRKLNEIMPKYKPLYKMLEEGADPMQTGLKYGKSRSIFSEFPETLLNGNSDYVSNGTDREYEDVTQGDWIEKVDDIQKRYNDVDVMILNELECMFSGLYTVSANGF